MAMFLGFGGDGAEEGYSYPTTETDGVNTSTSRQQVGVGKPVVGPTGLPSTALPRARWDLLKQAGSRTNAVSSPLVSVTGCQEVGFAGTLGVNYGLPMGGRGALLSSITSA